MKRFCLSFCFAAFLATGLVSCADDAAEVTPSLESIEVVSTTDDPVKPGNNDRP